MNDWSSFLIQAEKHMKAADILLTNAPREMDIDYKERVIEHLQSTMLALEQVGAWVRGK